MKRFKSFLGWFLIIICSLGSIFVGGWFFVLEPIITLVKVIFINPIMIEKAILLGICKIFIAFPICVWIAHNITIYGAILLDDNHD